MNDDSNLCLHLDAYFDGQLSPEDRDAFDAHLSRCAACREAINQQRWIDGLLTSDASTQIELAPRQIAATRKRLSPRRVWLPAAAAAALAALVALPLLSFRRNDGSGAGPLSSPDSTPTLSSIDGDVSPPPAPPISPNAQPVATFVSTGAAIALPAASPSPEVTVVQLYPTLPSSRSTRRVVAFCRPSPNGG